MARKQQRIPKEAIRRKGKVCQFCKEKTEWIDYKDIELLRRFMSDRGKIRARRVTGNCSQHQRDIAVAIKTTREIALLPYTQRTSSERGSRPQRPGGRRDEDATSDDRGDQTDSYADDMDDDGENELVSQAEEV